MIRVAVGAGFSAVRFEKRCFFAAGQNGASLRMEMAEVGFFGAIKRSPDSAECVARGRRASDRVCLCVVSDWLRL